MFQPNPKNGASNAWTLRRQQEEASKEEEADETTAKEISSHDSTERQDHEGGCNRRSKETKQKEIDMPMVNGKKYPYTPAGMKAAKQANKKKKK